MPEERTATVRSFAKINLDLRVLHKRPDGYHELRTIFQTISLADTLSIRFARARRTRLTIGGNVEIPGNLVLRAAQAVLDAARISAEIAFVLNKTIPMGAGLGGGSSNAAAVLLALPVLAGVTLTMAKLVELASALGSDVPFFLYGGTVLGIGRGTELYPLPDLRARSGLLIAPSIHVQTAQAYQDLKREPLTSTGPDANTGSFRPLVWALAERTPAEDWRDLCCNDFESVVLRRHPGLRSIKRRLAGAGAHPALMTGSGSALYGLFASASELNSAVDAFFQRSKGFQTFRMSFIGSRRYRHLWRRQLSAHIATKMLWPPRSLYSKP